MRCVSIPKKKKKKKRPSQVAKNAEAGSTPQGQRLLTVGGQDNSPLWSRGHVVCGCCFCLLKKETS